MPILPNYRLLLILSVMAISFLPGCQSGEHPAGSSSRPSPQAPSAQGTVDSGGGNTKPFRKVNEKQVLKAIEVIPKALKHVLWWRELKSKQGYFPQFSTVLGQREGTLLEDGRSTEELEKNLSSVNEKLFGGNFLSLLGGLQFVPKLNGPCHDLKLEDRDGSAFNENKNEICLSVERIKDKVSYENLIPEVLALAAHEFSHRVGANENEAVAMQAAILVDFKVNDLDRFSEQLDSRRNDVLDLIERSWDTKSYLDSKDKGQEETISFCMQLVEWKNQVAKTMDLILEDGQQEGFLLTSPSGVSHLLSMRLQVGSITDYCLKEKPQKNYPNIPTELVHFMLPESTFNLETPTNIDLSELETEGGIGGWFYTDHSLSGNVIYVPYRNLPNAQQNFMGAMKNYVQVLDPGEYPPEWKAPSTCIWDSNCSKNSQTH